MSHYSSLGGSDPECSELDAGTARVGGCVRGGQGRREAPGNGRTRLMEAGQRAGQEGAWSPGIGVGEKAGSGGARFPSLPPRSSPGLAGGKSIWRAF